MNCPHCQHANRDTAKVCAQCGGAIILANRYRILKGIGRGGMGAVYLGQDQQTWERKIVIKEMLPHYTTPTEQLEAERNFALEGKVLAKLNHPGIPQINDSFIENSKYYLIMTLAEGENLERRLERNGAPIPEKQVLEIALQVCKVLEYMGRQRPPVIHRDIKPANIIADAEGQIKLVDFGIARAKVIHGTTISHDTSAYGTPGYYPPEQERGQAEPRSDIYALGATMHHLLTGFAPVASPQQHFERIDRLVPNMSVELAQVVERMLDPNPSNRPSVSELAKTFEKMTSANPLRFPSGDCVYSVSDLVKLCDRYQQVTIQYLKNRYIENWLAEMGRADLATTAKSIRVELNRRRTTANPDEALERFLLALVVRSISNLR